MVLKSRLSPRRRIFASLLALSGMLCTLQVSASSCPEVNPEALRWLDKMSRSAHEISYQGVVTLQRGDNMQVMQISHSVQGNTASESLTQLTGQGARVMRVEHPLECIHPGHKLLRMATQVPAAEHLSAFPQACGLSQYYRFSVVNGERVAGRNAVRIIVAPRDMYRYGYVMELDKQTGLLLKISTIGRGEKVLERFQFASLSYGEQAFAPVEVDLVHMATHPSLADNEPHAPEKEVLYVSHDWVVQWVPKGFVATDSPPDRGQRKTYTDGLAVFSVFLETLPIKPGEGIVRHGGTTSYTRGMRLGGQSALVTVIGEVPVSTARMVADSIAWEQ